MGKVSDDRFNPSPSPNPNPNQVRSADGLGGFAAEGHPSLSRTDGAPQQKTD